MTVLAWWLDQKCPGATRLGGPSLGKWPGGSGDRYPRFQVGTKNGTVPSAEIGSGPTCLAHDCNDCQSEHVWLNFAVITILFCVCLLDWSDGFSEMKTRVEVSRVLQESPSRSALPGFMMFYCSLASPQPRPNSTCSSSKT